MGNKLFNNILVPIGGILCGIVFVIISIDIFIASLNVSWVIGIIVALWPFGLGSYCILLGSMLFFPFIINEIKYKRHCKQMKERYNRVNDITKTLKERFSGRYSDKDYRDELEDEGFKLLLDKAENKNNIKKF